MRSTAARASLLAGAAALLVAIPALSQDRRNPESILPPGFGDPQNLPPPEKATPTPRPPRDDSTRPPPEQTAPANSSTETVAETENGTETAAEGVEEVALDSGQLPRPSNYFTVPRGLERPTSCQHGPRRHELVVDLAVHSSQPLDGCIEVTTLRARKDPLVQPAPSVAEPIVRAFVGPGDESVEGHRHEQHRRGHRPTPCVGLSVSGLPAPPFPPEALRLPDAPVQEGAVMLRRRCTLVLA